MRPIGASTTDSRRSRGSAAAPAVQRRLRSGRCQPEDSAGWCSGTIRPSAISRDTATPRQRRSRTDSACAITAGTKLPDNSRASSYSAPASKCQASPSKLPRWSTPPARSTRAGSSLAAWPSAAARAASLVRTVRRRTPSHTSSRQPRSAQIRRAAASASAADWPGA
ncbi:MAG: hypothetical protein IT555_04020 [Acetobacteraceae bacterium]|nr:hypothetical protein [Acetobacteraceae bacterium]